MDKLTSIQAAEDGTASRGSLKLRIGGVDPLEGWSIVNIVDGPSVDFVASATNLSTFESASVEAIYASHVLERLSYRNELHIALKEFDRVLVPKGELMISVPDLDVLTRLYLMPGIREEHRFLVMRMIYGGQLDAHDFHKTGFSFSLIAHALKQAGFRSCERVQDLGRLQDTSESVVMGVPVNLNIKALR